MIDIPNDAPLDEGQRKQLDAVLGELNADQLSWLGSFVSGQFSATGSAEALTVLYGTESGNCEELASQLSKQAKQKGYKPRLLNMADASLADLEGCAKLLVVVSTWGDGEPPETAEPFYKELMSAEVALKDTAFSVCALGDTSYDLFCQTGKDVDARLEKLGAQRVVARVDCDVDYDESFSAWNQLVWTEFGSSSAVSHPVPSGEVKQTEYGKKNPYPAEVIENLLLSGSRSAKETYHIELSLDGSGLQYEPGDVLAVVPRNAEDVVAELLAAGGLDGDAVVDLKGVGELSLVNALTNQLDITGLSRKVATAWQEISGSEELVDILSSDSKEKFIEWSHGRQIVDLLESFPAKELVAQQFVDILRKLPVRLYSIASSFKVHPGEVHLTVAAVRYETHGKQRKGVASTCLADDAPKGSKVSVYTHINKNFRLPEDSNTPLIMVGPGTGIAPFRAFVEQRAAEETSGESWLFFGDQHYNEDFLYQLEWQDYLKNGHLSRLDVAFSRDQPEKVYVQDKLSEHAADVWAWLEKGAHFYVCGDASRMAKDVHQTLLDIVANGGGMSAAEAEDYVAALKKEKRYQRDVY